MYENKKGNTGLSFEINYLSDTLVILERQTSQRNYGLSFFVILP